MILPTGSAPSITRSSRLSELTTLRVGGSADICSPRSVDETRLLLEWCAETATPWRVLGRGSNLLVADEGVPGVVIHTRGLDALRFGEDGEVVAGAGVRTSDLVRRALARGLGGLQCLVGYPATAGGAARMNAGGKWGSTGSVIEKVRVVGPVGLVRELSAAQCRFGYRTSSLATFVVAEVVFRLPPVDPDAYGREIQAIKDEKAAVQTEAHFISRWNTCSGGIRRFSKGGMAGVTRPQVHQRLHA